ncbi:glycosyltransferase [Candidatus Pelagibacter sp.]|nr:glycosyltransferase [Candidatus Pelagibacter sp.]
MEKKLIYYWCPFISKVATVKAVYNSASSLKKYSNGKLKSVIIDVFGEWVKNNYHLKNDVDIYQLNKINFLFNFSSHGFLKSRLKYILIFVLSFFSLKRLLINKEPDYLIIHLVTSLPLFLNFIYKFKTKIILRISGKPKLNLIRYLFWKVVLKKVYKVTFPTKETMQYFKELHLVNNTKLELLYDPILNIKKINGDKKEKIEEEFIKKNDYYLAVGRLTNQKNFIFLIDCFKSIINEDQNVKLVIIGEGEQKFFLNNFIEKNELKKNIFLIGYKDNVFKYFFNCKSFILSSLWEDPGFVLVEAIMCNAPIISSNCSSGPKEIVGNSKGILFDNNSKKDFIDKFIVNKNQNNNEMKLQLIKAKKYVKRFTLFSHFNSLQKIL